MTEEPNIIKNFLIHYEKEELKNYENFVRQVANQLEEELLNQGIKAIVSSRVKKTDSLYHKLIHRYADKKYKTFDEIYGDIVDLAGIRIALYFPSQDKMVDEIINRLFEVKGEKKFPSNDNTFKQGKRFSGYCAKHYRIQLKQPKKCENKIAEIQVASVLMHAWSEVEHDLIYKPYS